MPLTSIQCPSCKGSIAVEERNVFFARPGQPPEFDVICACGQQMVGFLPVVDSPHSFPYPKPKELTMTIEIRDASLEARIQKQLQATGSRSVEEVLLRLLDTQEEQDRWLLENRDVINAKIRRGIGQLDRGEGIPEDQLDAYLAKLKAQPE